MSQIPDGAPSKLKPPAGCIAGAPNISPVAWSVMTQVELSPSKTLISTNSTLIKSSTPSCVQIVAVVSVVPVIWIDPPFTPVLVTDIGFDKSKQPLNCDTLVAVPNPISPV